MNLTRGFNEKCEELRWGSLKPIIEVESMLLLLFVFGFFILRLGFDVVCLVEFTAILFVAVDEFIKMGEVSREMMLSMAVMAWPGQGVIVIRPWPTWILTVFLWLEHVLRGLLVFFNN